MKKLILLIVLVVLAISTASALDPLKVAIYKPGGAANVQVFINDYTGGSASTKYTGTMESLTPNGSGIIIADIVGGTLATIAAGDVNSYYVVDVHVGGTLYAQYRLDQLILSQAQGGVLDSEGNLTPPEAGGGSVGSDDNRWGEVFVEENTVHIGPVDGFANNTELALSYDDVTNTAHLKVDATDALTATASGITVPGTLTISSLSGTGTRNIAVNPSGQVVVGESTVNTNSSLTGNGSTGSPLGIDLTKSNTWTTTQTFNDDVNVGDDLVLSSIGGVIRNSIGTSVLVDDDLTLLNAGDLIFNSNGSVIANTSGSVVIQDDLAVTAGNVTINALSGTGTRNIAVNPLGQVVVGESTVNTNSSLTGDGSTGSPLGIDLTNANSWTGSQTFGTVDINGGTIDGTAIGGASPSTGAFTTITGSSTVTLGDDLFPTRGRVILHDNLDLNGFQGTLQTASVLTGNRTYTLPDADGTLALVGNIVTDASLTGDGSAGSPLGIDLTNANSWTGTQTFGTAAVDAQVVSILGDPNNVGSYELYIDGDAQISGILSLPGMTANSIVLTDAAGNLITDNPGLGYNSATNELNIGGNTTHVGTLDQQGAVSNSTGEVVINDDANITGSLDVDTDFNVDGNTTHVGTLDQQGAVSNSTGDVVINDDANITGSLDVDTDLNIDGDVTLSNLSGGGNQNLQVDNTGKLIVGGGGGGTVNSNSTLSGDGSGGSPLGINLSNSNTWTNNQTFSGGFLITSNSRIALTNSDNNPRDIRWQEPSGSGSQYIGLRAPAVAQNSNYVFPASIGTAGQVLALNTVNGFGDSATTHWVNPTSFTYIEHDYSGGNTAKTDIANDAQIIYLINAGVGPVSETLGSLSNGSRVTVYNNSGEDFTFTDAVSGTLNVGNTKTWYRIGGTWRLSN